MSHVTLTARAGDIVGLLGPNGAGKSTIISVLATLVAPTSGEVRYGEHTARSLAAPLRARIGLLAHELFLYPELSARQNLAFFAALYGLDGATVDTALARAELFRSRGRRRVWLLTRDAPAARFRARAAAGAAPGPHGRAFHRPRRSLDWRVSARLRELAAAGSIVIVATHDLDLAEGLVTRVVLVREGRIARRRAGVAQPPRAVPCHGGRRMTFWRTAWLVLRKDFAIEVKSREILYTTVFFAVASVLIFSFAFVKEGVAPEGAAAGILWVAIAFAGTLALGRTFERERYNDTLRALLLAPAPRAALYVGKLLGMIALLAVTEALLVPLLAFLFDAPLFARAGLLAAILAAALSGSRLSALCSRRCCSACGRETCCCRSCCIRSRFL